jgi:hypothetical protein
MKQAVPTSSTVNDKVKVKLEADFQTTHLCINQGKMATGRNT